MVNPSYRPDFPENTASKTAIASITFLALMAALFFSAPFAQAEIGLVEELSPGVPFCSHISSSSIANYSICIEPDAPTANFLLRWRDEASQLELKLRSPGGQEIGPELSKKIIIFMCVI
jgi:hypothetical protein